MGGGGHGFWENYLNFIDPLDLGYSPKGGSVFDAWGTKKDNKNEVSGGSEGLEEDKSATKKTKSKLLKTAGGDLGMELQEGDVGQRSTFFGN